jgi:hypothetical protein
MMKIKPRRSGLTLIELVVASSLGTICMITVAAVFSDTQKAWNETYTKTNSAIMLDSQLAGKAFDAIVRYATCEKYTLDPAGHWVEVYYYSSETAATVDRYAQLKVEGGTFYIEYGSIDPRQTFYTNQICKNVTAFSFSGSGRCIRMQMTLSNNDSDVSFISSAVPQNQ